MKKHNFVCKNPKITIILNQGKGGHSAPQMTSLVLVCVCVCVCVCVYGCVCVCVCLYVLASQHEAVAVDSVNVFYAASVSVYFTTCIILHRNDSIRI